MADIRTYIVDGIDVCVMDFDRPGVALQRDHLGVLRGPEFADDMAAIDWAFNLIIKQYLQHRQAVNL